MVVERKLILDLKDLEGVVFRCTVCKQEVVHKLHASSKLQPNCPFCNEEWIDNVPNRRETFEEVLLNALRHFYKTQKSSPMALKLMVNETPENGDGKRLSARAQSRKSDWKGLKLRLIIMDGRS